MSSEKQAGGTGLKVLLCDCSCERKRKNGLNFFLQPVKIPPSVLQTENQTQMGLVKRVIGAFFGEQIISLTVVGACSGESSSSDHYSAQMDFGLCWGPVFFSNYENYIYMMKHKSKSKQAGEQDSAVQELESRCFSV